LHYAFTVKIWIDIVNSPHVLFFKPIIEDLKKQGHSIDITAREYAQTTGMLDELSMTYTLIGAHAGAKLWKKLIDVVKRSSKLIHYAQGKKYDLALTFNSASLAVAARVQRIRSMVFMDYEFQPLNHLTFRLCNKVVTPLCFPDSALKKFNALQKTVKYNGLKEEVYLYAHRFDRDIKKKLGIDDDSIVTVVRPPATMALYHRFANDLFYEAVQYILQYDNIKMVALPRSAQQQAIFESFADPRIIIPDKAVDGRDLLHFSDIVLSAGGTMNREAGILGIPAYTVFKGKIGAADKYLIDRGRIITIKNSDDFRKIIIQKAMRKKPLTGSNIRKELVDIISRT
jgi:predicted glycosyltransferase